MNPGLLTIAQPHFYESEEQTPALAALLSFPLPLPTVPFRAEGVLVCKDAELNYVAGEEVPLWVVRSLSGTGTGAWTIVTPGLVQVKLMSTLEVRDKVTLATTSITLSKWRVKIYATWPALT